MLNQVSPLMYTKSAEIEKKPILDDPYAYTVSMDQLTRHDFWYIENKLELGWITERDIEIVKFLSVHRWITFNQLSQIFFPESRDKRPIRKRVAKLTKYGLIRAIRWASFASPNEKKPNYFELGASGADILKYKYGVMLGQRDPRKPRPTTMLYRMKYIVTNELYLQMRISFELLHFEFNPVLRMDEDQDQQVPTVKYILRNPKGMKFTFYLLCQREDEKWLKTIRYQASFYKTYLKTLGKEGILVYLLSTEEKTELVYKIIEQEGIADRVWFVTDDDLFNSEKDIRQSFFTYRNDHQIYYDLT